MIMRRNFVGAALAAFASLLPSRKAAAAAPRFWKVKGQMSMFRIGPGTMVQIKPTEVRAGDHILMFGKNRDGGLKMDSFITASDWKPCDDDPNGYSEVARDLYFVEDVLKSS